MQQTTFITSAPFHNLLAGPAYIGMPREPRAYYLLKQNGRPVPCAASVLTPWRSVPTRRVRFKLRIRRNRRRGGRYRVAHGDRGCGDEDRRTHFVYTADTAAQGSRPVGKRSAGWEHTVELKYGLGDFAIAYWIADRYDRGTARRARGRYRTDALSEVPAPVRRHPLGAIPDERPGGTVVERMDGRRARDVHVRQDGGGRGGRKGCEQSSTSSPDECQAVRSPDLRTVPGQRAVASRLAETPQLCCVSSV